jgi:hypothetical protein
MLNPDEVRSGLEATGETLVKQQLGDGTLSPPIAEIAVRWLAAKQDERLAEQRALLQRLVYLATVAAVGATIAAFFAVMGFIRQH